MTSSVVACIVDLVGSRRQGDRGAVQRALDVALAHVNEVAPGLEPLAPTVGDECQGVFPDVATALRASLLLRLALPGELDCRVGLGAGTVEDVGAGPYGRLQDGPAWWAARDAIVEAKRRESGRHRSLRSWYAVGDDAHDALPADVVNAYLLCRDQLVAGMNDRARRILAGVLEGRTQVQIAQDEQVSQSAVSQSLQRSGAVAVVGAAELLEAR
ncbi:SatD family protein [Aeromicrobium massiliense]|uniref:SatD family protein n=1 Tax=Aeromicrobium massiliense TaxID=1464554 RepID=UPI0005789659|nr:SatD family protein [Aeromicrobium massiliense]